MSETRTDRGRIPRFLSGDILLFASAGDLPGLLTGWGEQRSGEGRTYAVHTAQFVDSYTVLEMDYVAKLKTFEEVLRRRRSFEVWRCPSLTAEQREALTLKAMEYLNEKFGWQKLFTHLLDDVINKVVHKEVFLFRRLNHSDRYPLCSWITAFAYDRALHYQFGVPPECADPDQIHDWVGAHPDGWVRIFCLEEQLAPHKQAKEQAKAKSHATGPARG